MKNSLFKVMGYMLVILLGLLVALPNVLPDSALSRLPSWLPHERVSLGSTCVVVPTWFSKWIATRWWTNGCRA